MSRYGARRSADAAANRRQARLLLEVFERTYECQCSWRRKHRQQMNQRGEALPNRVVAFAIYSPDGRSVDQQVDVVVSRLADLIRISG